MTPSQQDDLTALANQLRRDVRLIERVQPALLGNPIDAVDKLACDLDKLADDMLKQVFAAERFCEPLEVTSP